MRRRTGAQRGRSDVPVSFLASVGTVAAALRAGAGPEEAWRRVGLRTVQGVPRTEDLAALGGGADRHVAAVRAAARLSLRVGTPAAEMLERVTLAVARDVQAENARRVALAGPRATARLLAWLPALGLLLGAGLGARPWDQLLGGGAGSASGIVGMCLLLAGRRWTARQIRAAERAGEPGGDAPGPEGGTTRRGLAPRAVRRRLVALVEPRPAGDGTRCAPQAGAEIAHGGRCSRRVGRVRRLGSSPGPGSVAGLAGGRAAPAGRVRLTPSGRRGRSPGTDAVEEAVLLDLLEGAFQAGVGLPQALDAVGLAVGGAVGADLQRAARTLTSGATWEVAWQECRPQVRSLARALRPAWEDGVPPGALLRAAAEGARRERDARAAEAAARLGVRLVVPLGLCHLPAFVLVGLVPVLGSMATTTLGA